MVPLAMTGVSTYSYWEPFPLMKILVISPVLPPVKAGEADYAAHLCERLARTGAEVHVLTSQRSVLMHPDTTILHPILTDCSWFDFPKIWLCLRTVRPDCVIHLYLGWIYNNHPMATYVPWLVKKSLPGIPVTTVFYNRIGAAKYENSYFARWGRSFMSSVVGPADSCYEFGTLLTSSDTIVGFAEKHLEWLNAVDSTVNAKASLVPPPPILQIHPERANGRQRGRQRLKISPEDFVVAFFGYIYPSKGVDTLITAFSLLYKKVPHARLLLIGDTLEPKASADLVYLTKLKALAREKGVEERITWTGGYAWDSDEASQYLYAADAAAFPFDVGVALNNSSLAAAAAHGLPLISTRPSKLEAAFREGENILLCAPQNASDLADCLEKVANNPSLRARLSSQALRLASEWFSWDRLFSALSLNPVPNPNAMLQAK